jgi:2-keto-4-pentenoate hydratase
LAIAEELGMTTRSEKFGSALAKAVKGTTAKMKEREATASADERAWDRPDAPWNDPRVKRGMQAQLARRAERMGAGEKPLGWKIGLGAPAAMANLGTSRPQVGYLLQSALLSSGAQVNVKGWTQPGAEPEIAVQISSDVAPGTDAATARAAIAALMPAIELIDLDSAPTAENLDTVLAGNMFQRHVLLGEGRRGGGETADLSAHVFRRGKPATEAADPEALTGKVPNLLVHLANTLNAFGESLKAGDIVICGSTVPMPLIEPDETEFDYELRPIGAASVRFVRD